MSWICFHMLAQTQQAYTLTATSSCKFVHQICCSLFIHIMSPAIRISILERNRYYNTPPIDCRIEEGKCLYEWMPFRYACLCFCLWRLFWKFLVFEVAVDLWSNIIAVEFLSVKWQFTYFSNTWHGRTISIHPKPYMGGTDGVFKFFRGFKPASDV